MEQIDNLHARVANPQAGGMHMDAIPQRTVVTRRTEGDIPKTNAQTVSRVISDLWELSTTHIEFGKWPLSYYRNRRYNRLLANYCELLPPIQQDENQGYAVPILIGLRYIKMGDLRTSAAIIRSIKFHIVPGEPIAYMMRGLAYFVCGLASLAYLALVAVHSTLSGGANRPVINIFIAFGFGLLGSVVSLLSRISEFAHVGLRSKTYLIYIGATSPVVGGVFAIVVAALIQSNIINVVSSDLSSNSWLFVVTGFLSGFSERFSGNLLQLAVGRISGASAQKATPAKGADEFPGDIDRSRPKSEANIGASEGGTVNLAAGRLAD